MGPLSCISCCFLLAGAAQRQPYYPSSPLPPPPLLPVLFETEHFAVVAKPTSIPCHRPERETRGGSGRRPLHPGRSTGTVDTVLERARVTFPGRRIRLAHRLDAATSGCLLLTFSASAAREASEALSERGRKTYYALCRGNGLALRERGPFVAAGTVRDAMGVYRAAETDIEGLWGSDGPPRRCCLVRARPRLGRWHQVRQHLGRENFPIVGETRHHKDIRENRAWGEILEGLGIVQRVCLHCHRLEISPGGIFGDGLDVTCPLPTDMQEMIKLTDWAGDAQSFLPNLFESFPNA